MSSEDSIVAGMAGRYAVALFELAEAGGSLEQVESDLSTLVSMIGSSSDLDRFIRSPLFKSDEQLRAMNAVMKRAGLGDLTQNFIGVVIKNRRLFALPSMVKVFGALMARRRGEISADVLSAHPLSDSQVTELKEALKASMGKDVAITTSVDAGLLGGLIVKMGSRMIDASLRTKLNKLKFAMKEAG
ncbi:ATP synthase F1 subunit delta [Tepidicaulis marinus]|uniref:ATP synthase subunit delta n=1 Tax=Tepidicaulis marinus TaxID=1333998 RepID=A0A081B8E1_9HYPH|nr:F0F1 ATP synthase subunit delta [Tepidicaulis marinus]GAK44309.1 ATP synthase F1 subunit delta [Tepidicaulis marinus]